MFLLKKCSGLVLGAVFFTSQLLAQGLGNSPYSALGIGEQYSSGFSTNNGMGDVGVSSANGLYINPMNPALLVRNRYTTFDVGLLGNYKLLKDSRQQQREFGGNLGYIALSFPAGPKWSLGFSLKPYSYVNYQQNLYSRIGTSIYEAQYVYKGTGGVNKASVTNGFAIGKSLTVGAELSYLFGITNRSATSQVRIGDNRDYTVSRDDRVGFNDVDLKLGAAWRHIIKPERYLNFGAAYNLRNKVSGSRSTTIELLNSLGQGITNPDTIFNNSSLSMQIPGQLRVGVSYEKLYNLLIAFDYERQNWSNYKGPSGGNEGLRNAQSYHLGLEFMPKFTSTKYKDLIWYRAGFTYAQTPFVVGTKPIDDISFSLGTSLPIGQGLVNFVNLSVVAGQRGDITAQTFQERYARIVFSLSLKDGRWFQKFKVD
ncbi:MAG: hypothetical protein EAZ70_08435 [Runella slithyformis]|nr:MAG: hypothetical protein EAY79_08385 [Runella slithyformis]TAF94859.1 MAG: hypothetical protein EAZ46_09215 [Runella sp.]TAG18079.1 MAG: hypothetical protein EAZ38_15915 [Cytophagales bacterium]TAG37614.1 MAG: hypothetical protein EAZ32_14835 [Cytophagia bacterium]TAF26606.1 MAG: hypothetical protein EAZ70_08435 [Runella slithyformis]